MLTLRLLGNATLQDEHANLSGRAAQPRRLALLALLALSPRKCLSRDKLLAYLWPESDTEQGRHLLSVAVYELRKAIGEATLVTARDDVSLVPGTINIDVDQFEAAMSAGDYDRAIAIYTGPLLDGFHINDAPEFERWVDAERTLLARRFSEALEKAAQNRQAQGDREGAVGIWRRLSAHDPYSARVACGLMSALETAGDRAGALQHARAHAALLREEFGAEPDPEVEGLAARLRREPREAVMTPSRSYEPDAVRSTPLTETQSSRPRTRNMVALVAAGIVLVVAFVVWRTHNVPMLSADAPAPPKIAVLPFKNLSPADTSFFSDGLTEEIIDMLGREPSVSVQSRNSSFEFRGEVDVRTVAKQLGADYLVEGSVRRSGDRLKVMARLINVEDGIVWSEKYDRPREMVDAIAIQEQIAHAVVGAMAERLNQTAPARPVAVAPTHDVEAFELFVAGRHFYH